MKWEWKHKLWVFVYLYHFRNGNQPSQLCSHLPFCIVFLPGAELQQNGNIAVCSEHTPDWKLMLSYIPICDGGEIYIEELRIWGRHGVREEGWGKDKLCCCLISVGEVKVAVEKGFRLSLWAWGMWGDWGGRQCNSLAFYNPLQLIKKRLQKTRGKLRVRWDLSLGKCIKDCSQKEHYSNQNTKQQIALTLWFDQ